MRAPKLLLVSLFALLLPACGGGGGGLGEAIAEGLLQTAPPMDWDVYGSVTRTGVLLRSRDLYVGDSEVTAARAMSGFNVRPPIDGAAFRSATLRLEIDEIRGDIARLGRLWVEAVDLGDALDASDYGRPAYASIRVPADHIRTGIVVVDITPLMFEMFATERLDLDLRLRFSVDHSGPDEEDGLLFRVAGVIVDWE